MAGLKISGELSIYQVGELKQQFQQALAQALHEQSPLELDMSEMSECDGAGLQLLLSVAKSASEFEIAVHLVHTSPAMQELLNLYGLAPRFVMKELAHE
ncbi:MAG: STAS domain-containing protein [Burkholderiales bacterium]|nr:STAS domain-containing protein [Burkholderiales bacterium]